MTFIFRMKEALRIPMLVSGLPYERTISASEFDPNGASLYIHADDNALATRRGGCTLELMDLDELGYYDPFTLIDISDE